MATIVINDSDEARTALAELLYADLDQLLGNAAVNEDTINITYDDWTNFCHLLATLVCNPTLFNCLSEDEVNDLVSRAATVAQDFSLPSPNDFMFDF